MGDVLSLCCEPSEEDLELPPPRPKEICGREWHVLAKQLKAKRNAAIITQNSSGGDTVVDGREAQAKAHQIILLHQAMRSARNAQREQRRLQRMWRDLDSDVLGSIEI
jgi:hypothetical protein